MSQEALVTSDQQRIMRSFAIAWACCTAFYFFEYAVRSAPAVMIPELTAAFRVSALGVSNILGMYYYTYAATSLVAGLCLDRFGAKYVVPIGAAVLGVGCFLFSRPDALAGDIGRLLQGAGSAFAFTGAVYLAAHGFPAQRLATAIGLTQCVGMLGGSAGQIIVGPVVRSLLSASSFWMAIGLAIVIVALALTLVTPKEGRYVSMQPASKLDRALQGRFYESSVLPLRRRGRLAVCPNYHSRYGVGCTVSPAGQSV